MKKAAYIATNQIRTGPGVELTEDQRDELAARMADSGLPRSSKIPLGGETFRVRCKDSQATVVARIET